MLPLDLTPSLPAVIRITNALWCSSFSGFFFFPHPHRNVIGRQYETCTDRVSFAATTTTTSVKGGLRATVASYVITPAETVY